MPYTTAQDVVERLVAWTGTSQNQDALRRCRTALLDGYREIHGAKRWSYYYHFTRLYLNAPYSTGTVTYLTSTGSVPNELTIAGGGSWPLWADQGVVRIDPLHADAWKYVSSSVLQLDPAMNFLSDITTGVPFSMTQDRVLLPADFLALDEPVHEKNYGPLNPVPLREWLRGERYSVQTGRPQFYTVAPHPRLPDRYELRLYPSPSEARTLDAVYYRRPRAIRIFDASAGKVTVVNGGTAVSGSGTAFTSAMVGSVIRFSGQPGADPPTDDTGANPAAFETVVTAVASAAALTVADAAPQAFAAAAHRVSDYADVDQAVMRTAFEKCCVMHLAHQSRDVKERANQLADKEYHAALIAAFERDARLLQQRQAGGESGPYRLPMRQMPYDATTPS